jgi:SAM-dependent methyltransferase
MSERGDTWAIGASYESYVGRWSRLVAREFVAALDVAAGSRWLDVGCGTGALTRTILEQAAPRGVVGVDPSPGFLVHAREQVADPRVSFVQGDAVALPQEAGTFDAVVSGLVLNFVPDQERAVAEMRRVARTGGVVAAYVWDYAGEMQLMRAFWEAAAALDPAVRELDEGRRFGAVCNPDALVSRFAGAGLGDVDAWAIDVPTRFADFDDYWSPFLGGQGPAPSYAMSLKEPQRAALRDRLRATLPLAPDGSIALTARAWAVRGRREAEVRRRGRFRAPPDKMEGDRGADYVE